MDGWTSEMQRNVRVPPGPGAMDAKPTGKLYFYAKRDTAMVRERCLFLSKTQNKRLLHF